VTHASRDEPHCIGVWRISGNPCKHRARPGTDTCAAHDPAGDLRPPPPPDERRCVATSKETGERCRVAHPPGGTVCTRYHGGNAPQVRAKTKAREQKRRATAMVVTYGLPVEVTPEQAILAEVHRTAGHVAWLEQQVRTLKPDELTWGVTKIKTGGEDRGETSEAVPHVYLQLYQQERAHLAKVCADALRAGIEARQVKLAEDQGAMVAKALRAILADLKLTAAQQALVATVVPQHLRALALTN
jgi:hypothetical protein